MGLVISIKAAECLKDSSLTMTYYVLSGILNPSHLFTYSFRCFLSDFIAKVKDKAENVGQTIAAKVDSAANIKVPSPQVSRRTSNTSDSGIVMGSGQKPKPPTPLVSRSQGKESAPPEMPKSPALVAAQILMSCLHAWGLDAELDQLCTSKLGLLRPRRPISFGFLSRASGHMSLSLPGWYRHFGFGKVSADMRQQAMAMATAGRWQLSSAVTTQHLLAVISVANTLMSMSNATFISSRRTAEPLRQLPRSVTIKYNTEQYKTIERQN